eukprot:CAMPEP_0114510838 /NCGR_PEP_ID=MMETSP0109-20121206/14024_1 /TAXON_ID=29199 /ORGANISM="Chlorarachnion reptans, Strain CCCM449" /LENGTH=348 /DNA_ID=CAMNT_0001690219 /DNA_START=70 /DNA_END=1116 /DNA_ORIENTATION=+
MFLSARLLRRARLASRPRRCRLATFSSAPPPSSYTSSSSRKFHAQARYLLKGRAVAGLTILTGALGVYKLSAQAQGEASTEESITATKGEPTLMDKCVSEVVGTFTLITIGCGVVAALKYANYPIGPLGISTVWGATVALIVYATGDISGAHINPAISVSMAVNKPDDFPVDHLAPYIASQVAGATAASGLVYALFRDGIKAVEVKQGIKRGSVASAEVFNGAFGLIPNAQLCKGPFAGIAVEIWCTAHLAFFVFALTDPDNSVPDAAAPALIGTTVMTLVNVFGPVTGCGMNPARDIGPRIVTAMTGWGATAWQSAPMYTIGPLIGATLGGGLYQSFAKKKKKQAVV